MGLRWDGKDDGLAQKVLSILSENDILSWYTFDKNLSEALLDSFEEQPMYNGYSLAWHMLYPVYYVYEDGMTPIKLDKRIPKLLARIAILEDLYQNIGNHFDRVDKKQKKRLLKHCIDKSKANLNDVRLEAAEQRTAAVSASMEAAAKAASAELSRREAASKEIEKVR